MSKIRVYDIAKELGLSNKAVLDLCAELNLPSKTSHSSSLESDEAEKIRRYVIRSAVSGKGRAEREIVSGGDVTLEQRMGNVIRRRKKTVSEEEEAQAQAQAQQQKIDLRDVEQRMPSIGDLTPNLKKEREDREEALRRADALFVKREAPIEESATAESPGQENIVAEAQSAAEEQPVAAGEESLSAEPSEEEGEDKLAEYRRRHDIRAPKILGKIELRPKDEGDKADAGSAAERAAKGKKPAEGEADEDSIDELRRKRKQKRVLKKDDLVDYSAERDGWRTRKDQVKRRSKHRDVEDERLEADANRPGASAPQKKIIKINDEISVGEFAKAMGVKLGDVISHLMNLGVKATINQLIDLDTATLVASEFGHTVVNVGLDVDTVVGTLYEPDDPNTLQLRPPVVTVMGHVDHGKTSLLDAIRKTSVTKSEAGGITQHIGAYNVKLPGRGSVTFLDTPGHEAFTAMRSRGAQVTDIVVLVVAADDGFMPQTIEALNHAQAAKVPLMVAVNKIDKENANPDRIRTQMSEHGLVPEQWGGDTIVAEVSAHTRAGIDSLLENLWVQAEVLELKANPNRNALGVVVESKLDRGRGPVITVLVKNGTLKKGDCFVSGPVFGKVRALISDDGSQTDAAGPSIPVEVLGASALPRAGDDFIVFASETQAKSIAEDRARRLRLHELGARIGSDGGLTLERLSEMVSEGELKELPVIIKADVQGSVEAVSGALERLGNEEVRVKIIHKGVGAVTENDVSLCLASKGIIVGFNVRADARAAQLAESEKVEIVYSRIIYELIDTIKSTLEGMRKPVIREKKLGRVEVRDTFKVPKFGTIAGCYVLEGSVERNANVRLLRDNVVIYEGKMGSLRRFKDDVREVQAGYECGIGIDGFSDIKNGDVIEVFKLESVAPPLIGAAGGSRSQQMSAQA